MDKEQLLIDIIEGKKTEDEIIGSLSESIEDIDQIVKISVERWGEVRTNILHAAFEKRYLGLCSKLVSLGGKY